MIRCAVSFMLALPPGGTARLVTQAATECLIYPNNRWTFNEKHPLCAADGLLVKTLFPITGSIDHGKGFAML